MKITVAPGDGIGPEVMDVVLDVLHAVAAPLQFEKVSLDDGASSGVSGLGPDAKSSIAETGILLLGPIESAAMRANLAELERQGRVSLFEAGHGCDTSLVGRDRADPTPFLGAATRMLRHVGLLRHASRIEEAVERCHDEFQRRPDVRNYVHTFRTSVFRYLLLSELLHGDRDRSRRVNESDTTTPRWPVSLRGLPTYQLEGLA